MGRMISRFLEHVLPGVIRPLHVLWNEVIGFVFLVLAVYPVPRTIRSVRQFDGEAGSLFWLVLAFTFIGTMAYFGITSFLRARKISRS